ncbi:MAG: DNA repair exonuclease [Gammaproteobacteria bacterium]|nr:DNA repair exonuclease [Gammaproteobacteria bacterium]
MFRFIHTADIHLDSPLRGLARHEGGAVQRLRSATREAFDNLVTLAIDEQVDFVVIAGDLYDGDWRDFHTGLYFASRMSRLAGAGIKVYLLHGNHDAESQITRRLSLPDNVKVFGARRPQSYVDETLRVALHGQSFRQRDVTDNLARAYPEPIPDLFNIGVLHTALGGMGGHENYAPCSLDDLVSKGYDYWALGHVHAAQVLHEHPHVVFAGNLQGRHARETGPKGARLVTVEDGQLSECTMLYADVVRWTALPIAVDECRREADVVDAIRQAIERAVVDESEGRLLACRIELGGRSPLHAELLASSEHLLAQARAAALAAGEDAAWVEKLVISTRPASAAGADGEGLDAIDELRSLLAEAVDDPDLVRRLDEDVLDMVRKLPIEVRREAEDPLLLAAMDGDLEKLLTEVSAYLHARLSAGAL